MNQLLFSLANLGIGLRHHDHPPGTTTLIKLIFYNHTDNGYCQNRIDTNTESLKEVGDYVRNLYKLIKLQWQQKVLSLYTVWLQQVENRNAILDHLFYHLVEESHQTSLKGFI